MPLGARKTTTWAESQSGLLYPNGDSTDFLQKSTHSYLDVKKMGNEIRSLYSNEQIDLPNKSMLSHLIDSMTSLSDKFILNKMESVSPADLIEAQHLFRIAKATLSLNQEPNIKQHLKKLLIGDLDLLSRKQSAAKDFLWEIELFSILKEHGLQPRLGEPDLQIDCIGYPISFACKKVYSEKNLSKTISTAVSQIERSRTNGIVALNIEDLLPKHQFIICDNITQANKTLEQFNMHFKDRHNDKLRKYLSSTRIISSIIFSGCIAKIDGLITNSNQTTFWSVPNISPSREALLDSFYKSFDKQSNQLA